MIRVGITGRNGFIGSALDNHLRCYRSLVRVDSPRDAHIRSDFAAQCDKIVHLAAVSRAEDGEALYCENMRIVEELITGMEKAGFRGYLLFGSTSHIARETPYHASKRDGARRLHDWGRQNGVRVTTLLMPNTFGPGSRPFFNSVVSTFCARLRAGTTPEVTGDGMLELIPSCDLCLALAQILLRSDAPEEITIPATALIRVSALLKKLQQFRDSPESPVSGAFEAALYQTYYSYPVSG